jgi:dihydropteroate synthase
MNTRKIEMKQDRLSRVQAKLEDRKKALTAKGLDEKRVANDPMVRHFLAEARRLKHAVETLQWQPPKEAPAEAKAEKPAKEAAAPKAPKPPKEKKAPKPEQAVPV